MVTCPVATPAHIKGNSLHYNMDESPQEDLDYKHSNRERKPIGKTDTRSPKKGGHSKEFESRVDGIRSGSQFELDLTLLGAWGRRLTTSRKKVKRKGKQRKAREKFVILSILSFDLIRLIISASSNFRPSPRTTLEQHLQKTFLREFSARILF